MIVKFFFFVAVTPYLSNDFQALLKFVGATRVVTSGLTRKYYTGLKDLVRVSSLRPETYPYNGTLFGA